MKNCKFYFPGAIALALTLGLGATPAGAATHQTPNPVNFHLARTLKLGGTGGWDYLFDDAPRHRLYISHGNEVVVVDTKSWAVVGTIANTPGVHGIAISGKDGHGFTTNGRNDTVTMFDIKTLQPLAQIKVDPGPDGIAYEPKTDRVFTFAGDSNKSTAIDAKTGTVVGSIDLGGSPEFAAADGKGGLFNNIESTSEVVSIDPKSLKIIKRWSLAPGEEPSGCAVNPKTDVVFSTCRNGNMVISDGKSGKVLGTCPIDKGPDAAGVDLAWNLAFSSNGSGTVTVLGLDSASPTGYKVVQTLKTVNGARTMAYDNLTHTIYVVSAEFAPPKPGATGFARRGTMVPGSFTLYEYTAS